MAIENVRHPIKDTVKADNSTYSSNKIESLIHSATELPETGVEDAGDVLMVNDEGEWAKGEIIIPQEVPTPTASKKGQIISVNSSGDYALTKPSAYAYVLGKDGTNTFKFEDTSVLFTDLFQLLANSGVLLILNTSVQVASNTHITLPFLYFESMKNNNTLRFSNIVYAEGNSKLYYLYIDIDMATHMQGPITNLTVSVKQITTS